MVPESKNPWKVPNLFMILSHFISLTAVEERRPLSGTARRSGWIGCNLLLDRLPPDGWIEIIKDGSIRSPGAVRDEWQRFSFLRESTVRSRGWTSDVLRCVRELGKREFSLREMYDFEEELRELHPKNRHIRPKIRQQLQVLRDRGIQEFIGRGKVLCCASKTSIGTLRFISGKKPSNVLCTGIPGSIYANQK